MASPSFESGQSLEVTLDSSLSYATADPVRSILIFPEGDHFSLQILPPFGLPFYLEPSNNCSTHKQEWPPDTSLSSPTTLSPTLAFSLFSLEWSTYSLSNALGLAGSSACISLPPDIPLAYSFTSFSFSLQYHFIIEAFSDHLYK